MSVGRCRCCDLIGKLVGVYCSKCMLRMKADRQRQRKSEQYQLALNFGAGDLWRL